MVRPPLDDRIEKLREEIPSLSYRIWKEHERLRFAESAHREGPLLIFRALAPCSEQQWGRRGRTVQRAAVAHPPASVQQLFLLPAVILRSPLVASSVRSFLRDVERRRRRPHSASPFPAQRLFLLAVAVPLRPTWFLTSLSPDSDASSALAATVHLRCVVSLSSFPSLR